VRHAALFLILPFFLQLLGLGDTPLGGGLCGEVFRVQDPAFALKTPGFWYGLLFMVLLALELGYGLSLSSRTSSTELLLAASISTTSGWAPLCTAWQWGQTPQGGSSPWHPTAMARSLAVVVLPTPLGPEKR